MLSSMMACSVRTAITGRHTVSPAPAAAARLLALADGHQPEVAARPRDLKTVARAGLVTSSMAMARRDFARAAPAPLDHVALGQTADQRRPARRHAQRQRALGRHQVQRCDGGARHLNGGCSVRRSQHEDNPSASASARSWVRAAISATRDFSVGFALGMRAKIALTSSRSRSVMAAVLPAGARAGWASIRRRR